MEYSTFGPMEQNRLIEWCGGCKDPDDWSGGRVDYEPRNHPHLFVVKVEAEKELALPGDTNSGEQGLVSESRAGEDHGPEWSTIRMIANTGQR